MALREPDRRRGAALERTADARAEGRARCCIAIKAASLNFPDLLIVQNKYQMKPPLPFVPGSEYAGVVEAVGEGVTHLKVGQTRSPPSAAPAASAPTPSSPPRWCMPLPTGFALRRRRGLHHDLRAPRTTRWSTAPQLKAGETVLVLGAAGGVGTAAIQIAKVVGARVIAAASSDEKCALCKSIGADATINYASANIRDEHQALTDGKGPDVVYDPVGGDFAEPAFRSIAWRGRYLVVGFAAGPIPALPLNLALLKGASIVGVFWGDFATPRAQGQCAPRWPSWRAGTREGKIKPVIDRRLPMAELPAAYARMGSRTVRGKLVMTND